MRVKLPNYKLPKLCELNFETASHRKSLRLKRRKSELLGKELLIFHKSRFSQTIFCIGETFLCHIF